MTQVTTRPMTDRQLLKEINLKPQGWQLAKALGMTRQAIHRGLKTTKKPFLNLERLLKLYVCLKDKADENGCKTLRREMLLRYPDLRHLIEAVSLEAPLEFAEAWI